MPTLLPSVDLTSAAMGTQKTIDFTPFVKFDPSMRNRDGSYVPAHLEIFNESGCGLNGVMSNSGDTFYIPAGKWGNIAVQPNDNTCTVTVTYVLPNPPVSTLTPVYYSPGEEVPSNYTLGNSPIGIGGAVNVTSVQTLSNEGSAPTLLVIDIGDTTFIQLIKMNNDGSGIWQVDASGTKHQVLKFNLTANFLQLGQAGDISEVLGALTVDQTLIVTSTATFNGIIKTNTIADNVSGTTQITLATAGATFPNDTTFNGALPSVIATHGVNCTTPGDTYLIGSNGFAIVATDAGNKVLTLNGPNSGGGGGLNLQVGGVTGMSMDATQTCSFNHSVNFVVGSIGQWAKFVGTGNGTVATGVTNPTSIMGDPCSVSGSSQTIGYTVASSSVVTTGAGLAWQGTAWHA